MTEQHTNNLVQALRDAGVVGAGGAGFPTYAKIDITAELVIANGAECEPLLFKDQALMVHAPAAIVDGLLLVMRSVGAQRGMIAVKRKNRQAIDALASHLPAEVSIVEMEDVYPAGDEYEVVFHATGRRVPAGGYPTEIGVVVQNVETLYNVHRAAQGHAVTHTMMTVHGQVEQPFTAWLPLGMSYRDVLDVAGGPTIDDFVLIDGGPMMGRVTDDLSTPVTRISSGITVLARNAALSVRRAQPESAVRRFGKSACDQCSLCTEMCPRYLMGYPVQPHLVMRSLLVSGENSETLSQWAQPCSECNVCSLWACPEGLDPRTVCVATKAALRERGSWLPPDELRSRTREVHRLKSYRSVPTTRLIRRLGLDRFRNDAPLLSREVTPASVAIPLQQHVGSPAIPVVDVGDTVTVGEAVARAPEGALGVPIHASINGTVRAVNDTIVIEQ